MEIILRDWLVILGVLVVLGLLADGLRRMLSGGDDLRIRLEDSKEWGDPLDHDDMSLGSVRVVAPEQSEPQAEPQAEADVEQSARNIPTGSSGMGRTTPAHRVEPLIDGHRNSALSERRAVPPKADSDIVKAPVKPDPQVKAVDGLASVAVNDDALSDDIVSGMTSDTLSAHDAISIPDPDPAPAPIRSTTPKLDADDIRRPVRKPEIVTEIVTESVASLENTAPSRTDRIVEEPKASGDNGTFTISAKEEVLFINVVAGKDNPFTGEELKTLFQAEGLHFGRFNFFHRHLQQDGSGEMLFSVVNNADPAGAFSLDTLDELSTPSVSFLMKLPGPTEPLKVLNIMAECAYTLSHEGRSTLKDDQGSALTGQTFEYYRQRIIDFERRHLTAHKQEVARV